MTRILSACLALSAMLASPASAATLAEVVQHWTGRMPDVFGRGASVTIDLPPPGAVPPLTATAQPGHHGDDPGWQLSDLRVVMPVHLADGGRLTARQQHGSAWLGAATMQTQAAFAAITLTTRDGTAGLDRATAALTASTGPVAIVVTLDGFHVEHVDPSLAGLLPKHAIIRARADQGGVAALAAMLGGTTPRGVAVTLEQASIDIGPAQLNASGTVQIVGPNDRRGTLAVIATGFKELLRQMPTTGPAVVAYPVLMVLRQIGHKEAGGMRWDVTFDGAKVLVEGVDIGPLIQQ